MNEGYWKWKGQLAKRKSQAEAYDDQIIKLMATSGWDYLGPATDEEDMKEKWDHAYVKHCATDDEVIALVDHKLGGVRDDHVKYIEKHGKTHGVTHYAFARVNKLQRKLIGIRLVTVEHFMSNKKRFTNRSSGEHFWLLR